MKHKISDLSGPLLDLAVAQLELENKDATLNRLGDCWVCTNNATGKTAFIIPLRGKATFGEMTLHGRAPVCSPSTDWSIGGPIIERERIELQRHACSDGWWAGLGQPSEVSAAGGVCMTGPTALVAAMRSYVASKLGETVELP